MVDGVSRVISRIDRIREITIFWSLSKGIRKRELTIEQANKNIDWILSSEGTSEWLRDRVIKLQKLNNQRWS